MDKQTALRAIGFLIAEQHMKKFPKAMLRSEYFPDGHLKTFHAHDYPTDAELDIIKAGYAEYIVKAGKVSRVERGQMRKLRREPLRSEREPGAPAFVCGATSIQQFDPVFPSGYECRCDDQGVLTINGVVVEFNDSQPNGSKDDA